MEEVKRYTAIIPEELVSCLKEAGMTFKPMTNITDKIIAAENGIDDFVWWPSFGEVFDWFAGKGMDIFVSSIIKQVRFGYEHTDKYEWYIEQYAGKTDETDLKKYNTWIDAAVAAVHYAVDSVTGKHQPLKAD